MLSFGLSISKQYVYSKWYENYFKQILRKTTLSMFPGESEEWLLGWWLLPG